MIYIRINLKPYMHSNLIQLERIHFTVFSLSFHSFISVDKVGCGDGTIYTQCM